jgi:hypothetical protein
MGIQIQIQPNHILELIIPKVDGWLCHINNFCPHKFIKVAKFINPLAPPYQLNGYRTKHITCGSRFGHILKTTQH